MCTNQRRIFNPYTHKSMYVKCGHCPACLQEKAAHRVQRIRNNDSDGYQCFLLSLTYARHNSPYILRSEAYKFSKGEIDRLNIYRDVRYRYKRYSASYDQYCFGVKDTHVLASIDANDDLCSIKGVKDMAHEFDKISVCFYPDLQRFFARLRLNLKRNFNYNEKFSAYCCSEYGSHSHRSHFHVALYIRKADAALFRLAINKSWPFSNLLMFPRAFEEAHRASSYVASYVNSGSNFPQFLKNFFPPKHSYSKGFGCYNKLFSLDSIRRKFERGTLTYFAEKTIDGVPAFCECLIPKYIISRYFPLVKGYGRFDSAAQLEYLAGFVKCAKEFKSGYENLTKECFDKFVERFGFMSRNGYQQHIMQYDAVEIYRIGVRLINALDRFNRHTSDPLDLYSYLQLYQRIWSFYRSECLRLHMQNDKIPLNEKYDNLDYVNDVYLKSNPLPIGFSKDMLIITDPNKFNHVQVQTARFTDSFYEHIKHKNVANVVMSSDCEEF